MSHKSAKRLRTAVRTASREAAQHNRQKLYRLCVARCDGNLEIAAQLFQKTSAALPQMSPAMQDKLLTAMGKSLDVLRSAQMPVPQPTA